jgi:TP901 family phage tail tape measure protein
MSFDAGQVITTLGFKVDSAGAIAYESQVKRAAAAGEAAEARLASASDRVTKAHERGSAAQERAAAATRRASLAQSEQAAAVARNEAETVKLEKAMSSSGVATKLQAAELGRLTSQHAVLTAATEKTAAQTTLWSRNSQQAAKNLGTLGTVASKGAAVGILAVAAATVYAAVKAVSFNREMLKIQTQAGGSAAEVKKLSTEVLAMGGTVPQGPKELAEGLYHIESAGFRGAQAMEMLKASAEGAAIGGSELQATTQAMISVMASQIGGVHGAADAMGQLNAIVGVGDVRMEDLAKAMGSSGLLPVAAHFGLTLKDVGAMIATTTDNATPASVTLSRLRQAIALLGASSPKATKELASIGIGSKQLAEDMRKPNGGLVAIEDLAKHLQGLSKVDQAQLISKAFGGGRSSAGVTLLLDEITRLQSKYDKLGKSNGVKELATSWAAFQKSEAGAFGLLRSGAEAFATTVGHVVMPELTKLGHGMAESLSSFIKGGGAAKVGGDIVGMFDELGQVVSGLAPDVEALAKALYDVGKFAGLGNAGEIEALAAAFAGFKVGEFIAPMLLATAGAVKIFFAALAEGELLSTAGALLSLVNPVTAIGAAAGIAAGLFVLLSGNERSEADAAKDVTAAKQAEQAAIQSLNESILAQADATFGARKANADLQRSKENLDQVSKKYGKSSEQYRNALKEEQEVALHNDEAQVRLAGSKKKTTEESKKATEEAKKEVAATKERLALFMVEKGIGGTPGMPATQASFPSDAQGVKEKEHLAKLTKEYLQALVNQGGAGTITQIQLSRALNSQGLILEKNAASVAKLNAVWGQLSKAQQTKLAATPEPQLAQIGNLVGQLHGVPTQQQVQIIVKADSAQAQIAAFKAVIAGVPASKVIAIETNAHTAAMQIAALNAAARGVPPSKIIAIESNAASEKQKLAEVGRAVRGIPGSKGVSISTNASDVIGAMARVQAAIAAVQGKAVQIRVEEIFSKTGAAAKGHASGRTAGQGEAAVVGEGQGPEYVVDGTTGKGVRVDRPTLMGLGENDYVIPLEDRYRGRALGLFAQLARGLEVPGYKAGKKPAKAKHAMPVPDAIPPLSLPLTDIEGKESAAKSSYDKAASKVTSLEGQVHNAERTLQYASAKSRPKAQAKLNDLQKQLAKAKSSKGYTTEHRKMQEWARTLGEAKRFDGEIKRTELEVSNALNSMKIAASHGDYGSYSAAKTKRLGALGHLRALWAAAQKQVKVGSEYGLQVEGNLQQAVMDAESTEGEAATNPAAEREASTGMTDAEAAQLKHIEAGVALAGLTPDLGDDKQRAGELVSFLQNVLGEVQADPGARGGDDSIKSIADSLKTAQSNLASFAAGSTSTNESSDLQAQITQANTRAETSARQAQIAEQALQVFGGPGDIGSGGQNARGAVVIHQTNNMLHPSDPGVLLAVGQAATAGIGLQGSRRAVRVQVGP